MRVFVVERDADLRAFIETLIGSGHSVRTFECGSGALSALQDEAPDLLVADLDPCGASGEDLARAAAGLPCPPRVVLMSVDHKRLHRSKSLAQASVPKPFAVRDLVDALGIHY